MRVLRLRQRSQRGGKLNSVDGLARSWRVGAIVALALAGLAVLGADREPLDRQPFSDAVQYVTAADALSDGRYEATVSGETVTPRYPPGLPLVLAPASAVGGIDAVQMMSTALSLLLVGAVWWAARRMGGDRAAAVAGVLLFLSPFPAATGRIVMSDAFTAALTVLALVAMTYRRRVLAGVLVGYSAVVRLAAAVGVWWRSSRSVLGERSPLRSPCSSRWRCSNGRSWAARRVATRTATSASRSSTSSPSPTTRTATSR